MMKFQEWIYFLTSTSVIVTCVTDFVDLNAMVHFWHNITIISRHGYASRIHDDVIKWKHVHLTGPLWGESTAHRWIPLTKASNADLWCFLWSPSNKWLSEQSRRRWFEMSWRSLWRHCNVTALCGEGNSPVTCRFPFSIKEPWCFLRFLCVNKLLNKQSNYRYDITKVMSRYI